MKCPHCGKRFARRYGIGMLGRGTLYCTRCGKPQVVDFSLGWNPLELCDCGGSFDVEAWGCCPDCGGLLSKADIDPSEPCSQWE